MVKVSITLPNNIQITFESEEPEVIHEIVGMALRDLPRELMQAMPSGPPAAPAPQNGASDHRPAPENGTSLPEAAPDTAGTEPPPAASGAPSVPPEPAAASAKTPSPSHPRKSDEPARKGAPSSRDERAFIEFCQSLNPLGDMRRVLVATEGASRFLGMDSVDAEELARLFDLVGWHRPHSFVQTLRNSARSKFRWLERVPGRAGRYTATDLGRAVILDD